MRDHEAGENGEGIEKNGKVKDEHIEEEEESDRCDEVREVDEVVRHAATVKLRLNDHTTNVLLDSGALKSVIDYGSLKAVGMGDKIRNTKVKLLNASGGKMDIIGEVDIDVKVNGKIIMQTFRVLNTETFCNILLGLDFMHKFGAVTFDFKNQRVKLGKLFLKTISVNQKNNVRMQETSTISARTEQVAAVRCKRDFSLLTVDFEPCSIPGLPGVFLTKARVIPNMNGVFHITVLNTTEKDVKIGSRQLLGHIHSADELIAVVDNDHKKSILEQVTIGKNLTEQQKSIVKNLIGEYDDIFAENPKKPKKSKLVEHPIITDDALPVKRKYKRIPLAWEDEVEQQIQEMIKNDIIRPSTSPWNAPLILVKKKDGSTRFVCDFRGLNDVTIKDTYPLPNVRDVLDSMHGSRYWTTLDAASAYWSMPLREEDKEKTAFSVPRGKFEFNVTPYGLTNAGASYQRMMDICLAGLPPERILAYLDDIVIFSPTFEDHIADVRKVFDRLRSADISLKASKCVFASDEVEYLGYELSMNGIKPQRKLTEAILSFEKPENRKELKRFLGLIGFYRNFIDGFGNICHPLNRLTSENVQFVWSEECAVAFEGLKARLASKPVLAFPCLGKDFIVDVDASDMAFGGVLMQTGEDGLLHPVAYFSDAVQKSQSGWAPTTKEAFALVLATRHWHVYLAGVNFILNSDHNPLQYMREQKDPRGKFSRWILELEEYSYKVNYIPGVENVRADPLSRNIGASTTQPCDNFEEKIYCISAANETFKEQLKTEQDNDPVLHIARTCVRDGTKISQGRLKRVQKQLRIEEGILTKSGRPVIPASLRKYVVENIHNVAHFGVDKDYATIKDRFYWPNMYAYIKMFVSSCETCQKTNCDTRPPRAPLIPMFIPSAPMQLISLDIAYMPPDSEGYRYILLIGDTFSKFINAVPLQDQTAPTIVKAFSSKWLYLHGNPHYLLSDQGSNVDGDTVREFCDTFGIEKRRSSAYHSQGNGFAERNIRSIREVLRSALLDRKVEQTKWRKLLPELVFALNCSYSKAIQAVPYEVVFGRKATLPIDILLNTNAESIPNDSITPNSYSEELNMKLTLMFDYVTEKLQISKDMMKKQYDKNIRFHDYEEGSKVWLKVKHYKSGETRKLSPRRGGPWTVIEKLPNGVNFKIRNDITNEKKIVHHDRLSPVKSRTADPDAISDIAPTPRMIVNVPSYSSESESEPSDIDEDGGLHTDNAERRYPQRERTRRQIPGAVSWDEVEL